MTGGLRGKSVLDSFFAQGKNKNNKDDDSDQLYKLFRKSQADEIAEEQKRIADRKKSFIERKQSSLLLGNRKRSSALGGKNKLGSEKQYSSTSNLTKSKQEHIKVKEKAALLR